MSTIAATELISWLIAGTIAAWLVNEVSGRGSLGRVVDWIVGLAGALLAVFFAPVIGWLISLIFEQGAVQTLDWWHDIESIPWWYSVPLAFIGGLVLTFIFRRISHVPARPSSK